MSSAFRPCLILALDGATLDVVRPLAAQGRLPHLARIAAEGAARPLASTRWHSFSSSSRSLASDIT